MAVPDKKRKTPPKKRAPVKNSKLRFLKFFTAGLFGIVFIIMIAVFSIDPNNFRVPVTQILTRVTGLNIDIEFLNWNFSRGIQFQCKGLEIRSADQRKELLTTDELLIKLKWLPLLQQKVVIDSITLIKPVLKIPITPETDPNASANTIVPDPASTSSSDWLQTFRDFLTNPNLTLDEINLIEGRVIFQDDKTKKEIPLDFGVQIRLTRKANKVDLVLDDLKLGTGDLITVGEIRANDLLSSNSTLQASLNFNPFKTTDILPILDWIPQARNIINKEMRVKGNFDNLSVKFETPVAALADIESISKNATVGLRLKVANFSMIQSGMPVAIPAFEADLQWQNQQLIHKVSWNVLAGTFTVEGKFSNKNSLDPASKDALDSHLTFEKVEFHELKKILPLPMPWFPETGVVGGTIHVRGPVKHPEALHVKASFNVPETSLQIQGKQATLTDINVRGEWIDGRLTHQGGVKIFDGAINIKGDLDFKKDPKGAWDIVINSNVSAESMQLAKLRPWVPVDSFPETGTFTSNFHIRGPVMRPDALRVTGNFSLPETVIDVQGTQIVMSNLDVQGMWNDGRLTHRIGVNIFGGEIRVQGKLDIKKDQQGGWAPVINSDVITKSVQLAELRPWIEGDLFPENGTLTGKVHLEGPVMQPESLNSTGELKVSGIEIMTKNGPVNIPLLEVEADWSNKRLTHNIRAKLLDGDIQIKGLLDLGKGIQDAKINSDVIVNSVRFTHLKPFITQDWFPKTGVITGKVHLRGPVMRPDTLGVKGNFSVPETAIQIQGTKVALSDIDVKGRWHDGRLTHQIGVKIFGGEVRVQGDLDLKRDAQGDWAPVIDSNVITTSLHFAELRPLIQVDSFPESGEFTSNIYLEGPVMHPEALHVKGDFQVPETVIPVQGTKMALSNIDVQGEWQNGRLVHQVGVNVFGGKIKMQGDLDLKKDAQGVWEPVIDSDLIIRSINFPEIDPLVQKDWFPKKGRLTGTVHLKGPAKRFTELNISGNFSGEEIALNLDKTQLVVKKTLVSFKPKGNEGFFINLDMSQVKINKIALKKVMAKTFVSKDSFALKRGKILPKDGTLLLKGNYDLKTTSYKLDILGKNLRLKNFNEDFLQGPLKFRGSFFGDLSSEDFLSGLSGKLKINSEKGRVLKVGPAASTILNAMNFKLPTNSKDGILPYDYLGGSCIIKNGVLSTEGFALLSPSIKVKAYGNTDLSKKTFDVEVLVRPLQSIGKAINALESILDTAVSPINSDGAVGSGILEIPLIGKVLPENGIGNTLGETPVVGSILKKIPFVRNLVGGDEENQELINIYFSVKGTYEEPKVSFLPGSLFSARSNTD